MGLVRVSASSAVDEGRNPYGQPGKGNADEVWRRVVEVPCPDCGAPAKALVVRGNVVTIECSRK